MNQLELFAGAAWHDVDRSVEAAIAALRRMPYREYLQTAHWARQRAFALEGAGHVCELCAHDDRLEVHHRSYARLGFERPEDLIVLCADCHRDHHRALVLRAIRATEHAPLAVSVCDVLKRATA
jgi:5-methylcytosine-specific restriction endonuclease McrA